MSQRELPALDLTGIDLTEASLRVLRLPTVADKSFLITIGDRTVGAMTVRDQMVGPWQVPVADCAVTAMGFEGYLGEAMAMGERTPLAVIDAAASGRMAVGEAITNIAAAPIADISDIKLSANWMAACGQPGQDAALFDTVKAVGMELCPALGVSIPVGKDSLSMRTTWKDEEGAKSVTSPVSLIVSSFAPVTDIRRVLTPQIRKDLGDTVLIAIDLGRGKSRLGASCFAQVMQQIGSDAPDVDSAEDLKAFFNAIQQLNREGKLLAYHDRSDGGLFATLCEMAFAGRTGLSLNIDILAMDAGHAADSGEAKNWTSQVGERRNELTLRALFNEELGAVIQVKAEQKSEVMDVLRAFKLGACSHIIGKPNESDVIEIMRDAKTIYSQPRSELQRAWSETSWRIARLRDNPACADAEYERILDTQDPGITPKLTFDPQQDIAAPFIASGVRPKVAILREQGVNSHIETAYVMHKAGFTAVDVHMSDLIAGRANLADFKGMIAVGGFSYGDVLGAGEGWAKTILFNAKLAEQFAVFFQREDTFGLGICNGCQMMSNLKVHHPRRARLAQVHPQQVGAVRGAFRHGRSGRVAVDLLCRHGRHADADRRGARRRLCRFLADRRHRCRPRRHALCRQPRPGQRNLSVQSEWLAQRHHLGDDAGRPLHGADAARRARVPYGGEFLASARLGRGCAVDAHVPQCPQVGGVRRQGGFCRP